MQPTEPAMTDVWAIVLIVLGPKHDAIMRWAVGDDWRDILVSEWPARIVERTGIPATTQDVLDQSLAKIRRVYEQTRVIH